MIDRLDRRLLKAIFANKDARIVDIIRPFFSEKSNHTLRNRLKVLSKEGYVILEKQRDSILVSLTELGKKEAAQDGKESIQ